MTWFDVADSLPLPGEKVLLVLPHYAVREWQEATYRPPKATHEDAGQVGLYESVGMWVLRFSGQPVERGQLWARVVMPEVAS